MVGSWLVSPSEKVFSPGFRFFQPKLPILSRIVAGILFLRPLQQNEALCLGFVPQSSVTGPELGP